MKGKSKKREREEMMRYLEGRMSDEERNVFERQLQADLFYSDAIDGYQSHPGTDITDDLQSLDQQLNKRVRKGSSSDAGRSWVRAAASVAVLLAVSSVILVLLRINPDLSRRIARDTASKEDRTEELKEPGLTESAVGESLKKEQAEKLPDEQTVTVDRTEMEQQTEMEDPTEMEQQTETGDPTDLAGLTETEGQAETGERYREEIAVMVAENEEMAEAQTELDLAAGAGIQSDSTRPQPVLEIVDDVAEEIATEQDQLTREAETTQSRAKAAPVATLTADEQGDMGERRILSGLVRSTEDLNPMPGAVLMLKSSNAGTVSDNDGRFSLEVSSEDDILVASFIGMETQELDIRDIDYLSINMDPDVIALEEVVVIGYGVTRETKAIGAYSMVQIEDEEKQGYLPAEPEGGYELFKNYIEENIQFPGNVPELEKAVVILNFTVSFNGKPTGIRVIRSPAQAFSDEAIRLLMEGPEWKPAEQDGRAFETGKRVRIVFRK
jgi:hypothetical protein